MPSPSGPRLVAVEWVTVDGGQPHPTLLGVPFDGPMPGHCPGMPVHCDLHGWIWQANPDGLFAQLNPSRSCCTTQRGPARACQDAECLPVAALGLLDEIAFHSLRLPGGAHRGAVRA